MNQPQNRARRNFHRRALAAATAAGLLALSGTVQAQTWPDKPIRFIVPAPAGGGVDFAARTLAERLVPLLGQQVIVENKPGAAGIIGSADLLKSPRDGYTFMV